MSRRIRDLVEVRPRPTVVRLADLGAEAAWISASYHRTGDIDRHLRALHHALSQPHGGGALVIGPYGSGKSHFLAYLTQLVAAGEWLGGPRPRVVPVSLLHFRAEAALEDVVAEATGVTAAGDRRRAWGELAETHPDGLVLLLDELSEFLRAKPSAPAFNEDVRFLQFLGEWGLDHRLWVVAAAQEQVEHTGKLESALYRKLKDRYPLRLLLTSGHVRELIAGHLLEKKEGYDAAVGALVRELQQAAGRSGVEWGRLAELYPVHPATLDLLEEVRDFFSQTRGAVDFAVTRLAGDPVRGVEPFLDQPWGELLTPEAIFDHFADLLQVQPELCDVAQGPLEYWHRHLDGLFDTEAARRLAWRLAKLLVLVHLSRQRQELSAEEAAAWLLVRVTTIAPERNRQVVERVLRRLASEGRHVREREGRFSLDLSDDRAGRLDKLLARETAELHSSGDDAAWDALVEALRGEPFNPFELPREEWAHRTVRWHFHERRWAVYLGHGDPPPCPGPTLCIRLPWGEARPAGGVRTLLPRRMELHPELLELAALVRLAAQPAAADLAQVLERRLAERRPLLAIRVRAALADATVVGPDGRPERPPGAPTSGAFGEWLERHAIALLQRAYPSFEPFAPANGPLPREAYRRLGRALAAGEGWDAPGDDALTLVREGYLVPMGLLRRDAGGYRPAARLDQHELVKLVRGLVEQQPPMTAVYETLAGSVYGLVPDQIHVLLLFLVGQGEVDLQKARRSFRELHETFPTPVQYDRLVAGRSLTAEQLGRLEELCAFFEVKPPKGWSLAAQRLAIRHLREAVGRWRGRLLGLASRLDEAGIAPVLAGRVRELGQQLAALDRAPDELEGLEQLLFEIGPPRRLLAELAGLRELPERVTASLGELRRLRHLLAHPALAAEGSPVAERLAALKAAAAPQRPEDLDAGIAQARAAYEAWCMTYRERHGTFWREVDAHPAWSWKVPAVASSRHLGAEGLRQEVESSRQAAVAHRCGGLGSLEFQPLCGCGFDGRRAPIAADLERFDAARERLETAMRRFFDQPRVTELVRGWLEAEVTPGTQAFLAGRGSYPEVSDLEGFDRHLAGLELVVEVDGGELLADLAGVAGTRQEILTALERALARHGDRRLRLRGADQPGVPPALIGWCVQQALRHGVPLPPGVPAPALREAAEQVRRDWVGEGALAGLEALGLGVAIEDRVLGWISGGELRPAPGAEGSPLVAAAREVATPSVPGHAEELAVLAALLYRAHPRLHGVAGGAWLARLDALACGPLPGDLPPLDEALAARGEAQWVVLDAVGLPFLAALRATLAPALPSWEVTGTTFAVIRGATTTAAWQGRLAAAGVNHALHKANAVDRLLHQRELPFADGERLARAEIEVALRRLGAQLDRTRPVLVFADHGFRLAPDGRTFQHGGDSTLERVVPLVHLAPLH